MASKQVWAVQAERFTQYDGNNLEEILDLFRKYFSSSYEWATEPQGDRALITYTPPPGEGIPGDFSISVGDWVSLGGGVVSDADFQAKYVQLKAK